MTWPQHDHDHRPEARLSNAGRWLIRVMDERFVLLNFSTKFITIAAVVAGPD
jgi:hypothetical protein